MGKRQSKKRRDWKRQIKRRYKLGEGETGIFEGEERGKGKIGEGRSGITVWAMRSRVFRKLTDNFLYPV